jgi:hypothetical protein
VLSRVPQQHRAELVDHFSAMLDANGIKAGQRFVIMETPLHDGMLPPDAYHQVRQWLEDTASKADRRVAVLTQTMSGVLDTFKARVPKVAAHVEAQVVLRGQLRREAAERYQLALTEAARGLRDGVLLQGELLARWQDCAESGDLRRKPGAKPVRKGKRARRGASRVPALSAALRSSLESFIVSIADRAAEQIDARWRENPAGALLLDDAAADRARGEQVKQVFESAFGSSTNMPGTSPAGAMAATTFSRSSSGLPSRAVRQVAAWQDHLAKLAPERRLDEEAAGLVLAIATLAEGAAAPVTPEPGALLGLPGTAPRSQDNSLLAAARTDLIDRIRSLLDAELLAFEAVIDAAGPVDDVAAIRLYQAEYSLEAVR